MTTPAAQRLGQHLSDSAFTESATLRRQSAGLRDNNGKWVPGDPVSETVDLVSTPLTGEQRQSLPEGLRTRNLRMFYLAVEVTACLEGTQGKQADIIVYNGGNWHARTSEDWGGFWAVAAELK